MNKKDRDFAKLIEACETALKKWEYGGECSMANILANTVICRKYRKDYLLDLPEISEDSPLKDEAYTCECGSVHFHIRRDGKTECASCLKDVEISSVKFGASDE